MIITKHYELSVTVIFLLLKYIKLMFGHAKQEKIYFFMENTLLLMIYCNSYLSREAVTKPKNKNKTMTHTYFYVTVVTAASSVAP